MESKIAYLSSEFALSDDLPIYAGGLGILAADILYQAADDNVPLVGATLFYREGFFKQQIDEQGNQKHYYEKIDTEKVGLVDLDHLLEIPFPNRKVYLKIWKKDVFPTEQPNNQTTKLRESELQPSEARTAQPASLYLLDADLPENSPTDRKLAYRLYERVWAPHVDHDLLLGIGSVKLFRQLGIPIKTWHINDDHASFNILERLREYLGSGLTLSQAREKVKAETVFTTHTPVGGAESKFSRQEIIPVFTALFAGLNVNPEEIYDLGKRELEGEEFFSLTVFAMRHARTVNAVSKKHFEVAKELWGFIDNLPLTYITNGVYSPRWTAPELANFSNLSDTDLWNAKLAAKKRVSSKLKLDPNALVLAWAKRFTQYKQPLLLLSDLPRLAQILNNPEKPVYLLMSGKAHPEDPQGQEFVKTVISATHDPRLNRHLIYVPNYNLGIARDLLAASDVWINTPVPGWEASGTSGMKAVFNGALNASTLDGWWAEGFQPEAGKQLANGWAIDPPNADALYQLLEEKIVPTYFASKTREASSAKSRASFDRRGQWLAMVKEAFATCGTRFNTKRMLEEYQKLYFP